LELRQVPTSAVVVVTTAVVVVTTAAVAVTTAVVVVTTAVVVVVAQADEEMGREEDHTRPRVCHCMAGMAADGAWVGWLASAPVLIMPWPCHPPWNPAWDLR
jgi:hypothetical protein